MAVSQDVKEDVNGNIFSNMNDGSGTALTSTNNGGKQSLDVNLTGGTTSGAVADKTAFTYGTTSETPVGGVFQDTSPTLTSGTTGALRLNAQRGLHINIRKSDGSELGNTNATGIFVIPGDGTNAQAYSATSEAFAQLRQGGNVANVTASNELKVIDTNSGLVNGKMSPATSTLSQLALSTSSQTALALNAARKGAVLVNDSNKVVYIAFSATATAAAYSYKLQPNTVLEMMENRVYTGIITAISVSGISGNLVCTELT